MANGEVRTKIEGSLSLVQASASGGGASGARVWATGATPSSALNIAYVESLQFTSARTVNTISNRGLPTHHKNGGAQPINVTLGLKWTGAWTGFGTAAGATMPMVHAEIKYSEAELGGGTARYYQFYGLSEQQMQFSEADDGNMLNLTFVALGMSGANSSGYLT